MVLNITIEIWKKGNWYFAKAPELDFISQGRTPEEAKSNLLEVVQIQFEEMAELGTLDEWNSNGLVNWKAEKVNPQI
ncbi:MAG: type II toxin-antitoxin system HicB family antitoxin [Deltaproteobacteria bacterium]|nr:type II toxin-antitoxin system HicB family antitoxin [Deltaproteobacteria bacterium]